MLDLDLTQKNYLSYCKCRKQLNEKTIKAYKIDLSQFADFVCKFEEPFAKDNLSAYIIDLHKHFSPNSVRRKIASVRAYFHYLLSEDYLQANPFAKIDLSFKAPFLLPKTIPQHQLKELFRYLYGENGSCKSSKWAYRIHLRDIAVIELLLSSGIRVSELCSLRSSDIDLSDGSIRIMGKGARERIIQIGNESVLAALCQYQQEFRQEIILSGFFFVNSLGRRLSDQSVRNLIHKAVQKSGCQIHITPHMFRHSFATMLLDQEVDIRYIQQILGHSTIVTTQIYTHVSTAKQRQILMDKSPRNLLQVV